MRKKRKNDRKKQVRSVGVLTCVEGGERHTEGACGVHVGQVFGKAGS